MGLAIRSITGTTDTPTTADVGKLLVVNNASQCTMTLNNSGWAAGDWFSVISDGTGGVLFSASGTTLNNADSTLQIDRQFGNSTCIYEGSNNWWILPGLSELSEYRGINTRGTGESAYNFVLADAGKLVEAQHATAWTGTVPPNSSVAFAVGAKIDVARYGAGTVTIAQGSGVTIRGTLTIGAQYDVVTLIKRATDEWYMVGGA